MVGVDPANVHIDAHSVDFHDEASQHLHTLAPFRASITGRAKVYGIQGMPLKEGFCDLSHFGMGNRHRGGFISLPLVYTDLHKLVSTYSV